MCNSTLLTKLVTLIGIIIGLSLFNYPAMAQEAFIGEIRMFGISFCPRGWTETNGQELPIVGNEELFSLLGTTYGGDGRTTFALPDLRGRVPINHGQGAGLSSYQMGQRGGVEEIPSPSSATVNVTPSEGNGITAIGELRPDSKDNRQPYLTVRYCIALIGIYPSRN